MQIDTGGGKLSKYFLHNHETVLSVCVIFRIPERAFCYHFLTWDTKLGQATYRSERGLNYEIKLSLEMTKRYSCNQELHLFFFLTGLKKKKKVCFKSYLSLISVCSVVFNITYWKNFNSCFTMKSFVILQQAFACWIVKQPRLFASSRWSSI